MIITKIRLQEIPLPGALASWLLPVFDFNLDSSAGDNGYILKNAFGLGPPDFISIVEGFTATGVPIKVLEPEAREVVLRVGFRAMPGSSFNSLRESLYRIINKSIYVKLMNEALVIGQVTGTVQKFEVVHFSNQPEVQLTILCDYPEFSGPMAIDIPVATLDTLTPTINYPDGTAPTGLNFQITFTATPAAPNFSMTDATEHVFTVAYALINGDVLTVSTHRGSRKVTVLRSSVTYDVSGNVVAGAFWPRLYPGPNSFTWNAPVAGTTINSASYIPRYWGV